MKKMKVAPFTYTVEEVRGLPDAGNCTGDFSTILLAAEQTEDKKTDTLLHEALHALFGQGLGEQLKEYDKTLEETLCGFLAPRLLGLLRDNPWLVERVNGGN